MHCASHYLGVAGQWLVSCRILSDSARFFYTISFRRLDDVILTHLIKEFPELTSPDDNYAQLRNLDENAMKTPKGKEMWRNFCMTVRPSAGLSSPGCNSAVMD